MRDDPSFAGGAVHRKTHGNPQLQHLRHPGHAGGQLHVADGAVGHAGAGAGQLPQLLVVEVDAVGIPHVRACPAQGGHILQRPDAEMLQGVALLVLRLAQVGVEPDAVLPGQNGALPQQLPADGEGGAGGQGHLPQGAEGRVVIRLDDPGGVLHDGVHRLDHAVRRQAPVLAGEVHAAPGGEHPHAQLLRGGELGADQVPAPGGEDVVVVKAGGAAVLQQLAHAGEGAEAHHVLVQALPDLVQGGEPVEQLQVLHLGQISGEHLIEVVVGVDEAGVAPAVGPVDHRVGGLGQIGADGPDHAVLAVEIRVFQNGVAVVTGDNGLQVAHQQRGHGDHAPFWYPV